MSNNHYLRLHEFRWAMKSFSILLLLSIYVSEAQTQSHSFDTVVFCKKNVIIPSACATGFKSQISCDDYFIHWLYPPKNSLATIANTFTDELQKQLNQCTKETLSAFLLNEEVVTIKISCNINGIPTCHLISYGVVNNQPVVLIMTLYKNAGIDDDLPDVVKKIFRFRKVK
jgi:hypothetical protein